jgi:Tfp pilus assembly protein PilN
VTASWNFARRPFRDDRPVYAGAAVLFAVGAILLVSNVRLFAAYRHDVADVRAEIAALEARQRGAEARTRDAKAALSSYKLSALADESRELSRVVAERRFSWTGLLARLERTLPSDVGIQRLQPHFDKDGHVALDLLLVGRSREAVVPTIAALTQDPAFSAVTLHNESQPEGNTADPFQFSIGSRYEPEAPLEKASAAPKKAASSEKKSARPAAPKPAAPGPGKPGAPGAGSTRPGAPGASRPAPRPTSRPRS